MRPGSLLLCKNTVRTPGIVNRGAAEVCFKAVRHIYGLRLVMSFLFYRALTIMDIVRKSLSDSGVAEKEKQREQREQSLRAD